MMTVISDIPLHLDNLQVESKSKSTNQTQTQLNFLITLLRSPSVSMSHMTETHEKGVKGRGRTGRGGGPRNGKKSGNCLKFHNFVANQRNPAAQVPDTHCLREEHGTKQITVAHWRKSNASDDELSIKTNEVSIVPRKLEKEAEEDSPPLAKEPHQNPQQSILEALLAKEEAHSKITTHDTSDLRHKINKRKPLLVRRVLRDQSSLVEQQDEPLDLSLKKKFRTQDLIMTKELLPSLLEHQSDSVQNLIKSVEQSAAHAASIIASVSGSVRHPPIDNHVIFNTPSVSNSELSTVVSPEFYSSNSAQSLQWIPSDFSNMSYGGPSSPNSSSSNSQRHLKQKSNQRGAIKQKLEETFRQNGFLVKTKQVSDGEATFCKFRQLRKYTRYYLKSWHQHLPDEVNKLWKGFLPPKTAKPVNSSQSQ